MTTPKLKDITDVVFDVDGTLYAKKLEYRPGRGTVEDRHDYFRHAAFKKALEEGVPDEQDFINHVVGVYRGVESSGTLQQAREMFPQQLRNDYNALIKKYGTNGRTFRNAFNVQPGFFHKIVQNTDFASVLANDPRLQHLMRYLDSKQYRKGLLTGERMATITAAFGVLGLDIEGFRMNTGDQYPIICSDNSGHETKPSLEIFRRLLRITGAQPHQVAYVGDSMSRDILPAMQLGIKPVHVSWKPGKPEQKQGYIDIPTIYDLEKIL